MGVRYVTEFQAPENESFSANWNKPIEKNSDLASMKVEAVGQHPAIIKKIFIAKITREPCLGKRTDIIFEDNWLRNRTCKIGT